MYIYNRICKIYIDNRMLTRELCCCCKIIRLLKENSWLIKSNLKTIMKKDGFAKKSCKMSTFN